MLRNYFILILFCVAAGRMFAQEGEPDYRFFHRLEADGSVKLRVMPTNRQAFFFANTNPQRLEVFARDSSGRSHLAESVDLQPVSLAQWLTYLPSNDSDSTVLAAIHYDRIPAEIWENSFADDPDGEDVELLRFGLANFSMNYDFETTLRAGYGHRWPAAKEASAYAIRLYPTPTGDTLYYNLPIANRQAAPVPELKGKFKKRRTELEWSGLGFGETYFGYQLFRSVEDGPFQPVYDHALVNALDTTVNRIDSSNDYFGRSDTISEKGLKISYRLHGADYLGGYSESYSELTGLSGSDLELSPTLIETVQTDSNYAIIRWEYDRKYEPSIAEFRILHRPTSDGKPEVVLTEIPPSTRSVAIPMSDRSNFYRVQAVSTQGTELTSFESLVLAYDVTPPAVPTDFGGYIDTLGHVYLSWSGSNEEDLRGYYLFKGLLRDREMAMFTNEPLTTTDYVDTVSMETGNDTVFYQIRSVDTRGNGSNFSPILALVKPDVFPPAPPQFLSSDNDGNAVFLQWTTSPSDDVVTYRLYRRADDDEWMEYANWPAEAFPSRYTDEDVSPRTVYAYALEATDDADLVSERSQPVSLRLKDFKLRDPVENFTFKVANDGRSASLAWVYGPRPRSFHLYRGEVAGKLSLLKELPGDTRAYTDGGLAPGKNYRYLLRAVFPNGVTSPFEEASPETAGD